MANPLQEAQRLGQSIWYDNMRRGLIVSGELARLVDEGVTGLTSNPTIFEKAIAGSTDYDDALLPLARSGKSAEQIYEALAIEDIRAAADLLRPVYDHTEGADGYASLEVSPRLAHDTDATVAEAERLFATLDRPNVMVKVPATPEGVPAVRRLIGQGININVTLIFALELYREVMEAYLAGLEDFAKAGGDVSRVASVASFFVSRVDTAVDALLDQRAANANGEALTLRGKAAVANAKMAYRLFQQRFGDARFDALRAKGARVQRPLWASTGTKNPAYSDVLYVETLLGPHTVNTMPPQTLTAFMEHGTVAPTVVEGVDDAEGVIARLDALGISMRDVTDKLLADGVKAFADSFDTLIANVAQKVERLSRSGRPSALLGEHAPTVEGALKAIDEQGVVERIWRKDHTVWKPEPTEIVDRLGWLDVTEAMRREVPGLTRFAGEVRNAGYRHVVLLGMGGSSLGPEVLRQTFGSAPGYPELLVLDTTVPAWIKAATGAIDPAKTLFLVSSKSGGTIETMSLYRYFRALVEDAVGHDEAGANFVAITDPGTSLERLAVSDGFRRAFLNPSDIGGRYSVLSFFGLVPAALIGLDVTTLLDRADALRAECAADVPVDVNPGVWLGAAMGALASAGRDKLTLVTSRSIASFGLWVEQLIAESTGKEGRGIVPVAGEPLLPPDAYGGDRFFVYLRADGDDNAPIDDAVFALEGAGHPVLRLTLRDVYDLGAELYRWEFATAVAGHVLGIQPFDQPNVQAAKDRTAEVLAEYEKAGSLPRASVGGSPIELVSQLKPGDYLAVMAYVQPTPDTERAVAELRRRAARERGVATTFGYGPRFLHSTGQLHKGGPGSGAFLQVTQEHAEDVAISGAGYTFGVLADAQAIGDLRALADSGRRVASARLRAGESLAQLLYDPP